MNRITVSDSAGATHEVVAPFDHVVRMGGPYDLYQWPAAWTPFGMVVDLRLFDANYRGEMEPPPLTFQPSALKHEGIAADVIAAAHHSEPPGFVLIATSSRDAGRVLPAERNDPS